MTVIPKHRESALNLLRPIFGDQAERILDAHQGSVRRIVAESATTYDTGWDILRAVNALVQYALLETAQTKSALRSPQAVRDFLHATLGGRPVESFGAIFLDAQNRVIAYEELFRGTLTQTSVYPREVMKRALHFNAAAVILAHNHPSGTSAPSHADQVLTQALKDALALADIRILDHMVVGDGEITSMAEIGLI